MEPKIALTVFVVVIVGVVMCVYRSYKNSTEREMEEY